MPSVTRVAAARVIELTLANGRPYTASRGDTVVITEAEAARLDAMLGGFAPGLILARVNETPAQVTAAAQAASNEWDSFYQSHGARPAENRPRSYA